MNKDKDPKERTFAPDEYEYYERRKAEAKLPLKERFPGFISFLFWAAVAGASLFSILLIFWLFRL